MDDVTTLTSDKVDSCFLYNILKKKVLCNPTVQYKYRFTAMAFCILQLTSAYRWRIQQLKSRVSPNNCGCDIAGLKHFQHFTL